MGSPEVVREAIDRELASVAWYDGGGCGQYGDEHYLLEFQVGPEDPVVCVFVKVRGLGAPQTLLQVSQACGWCLVDGSSMEVIGPEHPWAA
jgi:hypothetical protein